MEISSVVSLLANYFRLSLGKGKNVVRIADELELIRAYVDIQEFRFQNKIDMRYEIDGQLLEYFIPKMTLQPVVENAILHGICKNNVVDGRIDLSIKRRMAESSYQSRMMAAVRMRKN